MVVLCMGPVLCRWHRRYTKLFSVNSGKNLAIPSASIIRLLVQRFVYSFGHLYWLILTTQSIYRKSIYRNRIRVMSWSYIGLGNYVFGGIVWTVLASGMDSFSFFASPAPSVSGSLLRTSSPCPRNDRSLPNTHIALHQKLDLILAGNMEQAAAIDSLRKENEVLKTELGRMTKEVEHLVETSAQQTCCS